MNNQHVGLALLSLLAAFSLACGLIGGGSGATDGGTPAPSAVATLAAPSTAVTRAPATPRPAVTRAVATTDAVTTPETPVASDTAEPGAGTVVVANTDGEGVFIRGSKQMADRLQAYADGTELTVTGPEEEGEGISWLPVRAPDGTEGWVPSQYTEPAG